MKVAAARGGGMFDDPVRYWVFDGVKQCGPRADQKLTDATGAVTRLLRT